MISKWNKKNQALRLLMFSKICRSWSWSFLCLRNVQRFPIHMHLLSLFCRYLNLLVGTDVFVSVRWLNTWSQKRHIVICFCHKKPRMVWFWETVCTHTLKLALGFNNLRADVKWWYSLHLMLLKCYWYPVSVFVLHVVDNHYQSIFPLNMRGKFEEFQLVV